MIRPVLSYHPHIQLCVTLDEREIWRLCLPLRDNENRISMTQPPISDLPDLRSKAVSISGRPLGRGRDPRSGWCSPPGPPPTALPRRIVISSLRPANASDYAHPSSDLVTKTQLQPTAATLLPFPDSLSQACPPHRDTFRCRQLTIIPHTSRGTFAHAHMLAISQCHVPYPKSFVSLRWNSTDPNSSDGHVLMVTIDFSLICDKCSQ